MSTQTLWMVFITIINVSICISVLLERHLHRAEYQALRLQAQQSAGLVMLYVDACQSLGIDIDVESKLDGHRIKNKCTVTRNVVMADISGTVQ